MAFWNTSRPRRTWGKIVDQKRNLQRSPVMNRFSSQDRTLFLLQLLRSIALLSIVGSIVGSLFLLGAFAWYSKDLPQPGRIVRRDGFSTQFLDRDGKLLYDVFADQQRTPVKLDQITEYMRQATIATEDKDFYNHPGFDPLTPLRVTYNAVFRRQRLAGGSTLTQQLVKNVLLTNERRLDRKLKELILAIQIERQFTKDQILEMYLNEIPYGGPAMGVQAASQLYFSKDASQLSLVEAAILAGLPQRPSAYSPYIGKKDENDQPLWKGRAVGVLRRMREDGYITPELETTAVNELDSVVFQRQRADIKAPHFVFYANEQLAEMFGDTSVEGAGFKVTTTLDLDLQDEAETIVTEEIEKVESLNITNGALVVMDPENGQILSMVGSKDYFDEDIDGNFNVAVNGLRQPGSSIKPVTYLLALRKGLTPASMLIDVPTTFAPDDKPSTDPYEPKNYDGRYRGPVSLRNSLGSSLNVPAVKLLARYGVQNMLSLAYDMGFPTLEPTNENMRRFGLSVTLGGGEVHLIDTVTAYSSFANGGKKVEPIAILKVEDRDGNVIYENKPVQGKTVMSAGEAFLINHILSDNSARLLAFGANSLLNTGKPIAVKTGTTNDQKDNWTIGWSQTTMVGVWVGNSDNSAMKQVASGITGASPIWRRVMFEAIAQGRGTPDWEVPSEVEEVEVDAISGYPAHDNFPSKKEYVVKGTLPSLPDPIHSKLKLCRGQNRLASEIRIAKNDYDEKEFIALREEDPVSQDGKNRWQDGINAWVSDKEDIYKPPTEYCDNGGNTQDDIYIRLLQPENERTYQSEDIEIEVDAVSVEGIDRVEIWVDDQRKETLTSRPYKTRLHLPKDRYEIYAKARDNKGREVETSHVRIGTGNENWATPTPSPSPTNTPQPSSSPLISPLPSLLPDDDDDD